MYKTVSNRENEKWDTPAADERISGFFFAFEMAQSA